ncbi:copper transporter [Brevibacillus ruminantium]|uniref:Copper transporter n=1 Tax=Brevibacillus ruminantium TaxID=2950604 RepID=A0ABY4W8V8_9BACL|nr:copper transporter [Brevibacillus ruminantium]USG63621.1 copper transporter [Brevibacillus ruminantium]
MIPFRHHLISLAAVFLSLGIGILLGGMAGQPWFSVSEKEVLSKMESRYQQALKSNSELKQQMNRLQSEIEKNKAEAAHLMAARYTGSMEGNKLYLWHSADVSIAPLKRLLKQTGAVVVPYGSGITPLDGPLLVLAVTQPEWLHNLPENSRWLFVDQIPETIAQQWALLEQLQNLMTELKAEREKS